MIDYEQAISSLTPEQIEKLKIKYPWASPKNYERLYKYLKTTWKQ